MSYKGNYDDSKLFEKWKCFLGDLDWFHMETKMRALVRDILNPVLEQNTEESERYLEIDKRTLDFVARLEILEYAYLHNKKSSKSAPTIFDSIFNRFNDQVSEKNVV